MNKQRLFALLVVWGTIILIGVLSYRFFFKPRKIQEEKQAKQEQHENLIAKTSSSRHYNDKVSFGIDSFSGYATFRSPTFANHLASRSIKLDLQDDGANYIERIKKLADGRLDMAVFTIDALVKASATVNDLPATITGIVDRSNRADAIVGYKSKYPNVQSLDTAKTKFVLTPDSPSEMMVRVLQAHFNLPNLNPDCYVKVGSAKEVYEVYRKSNQSDDQVYVVWEPYVQKMLENPNLHIIVDSSNFRDYIVDVLVVSRDFLSKQEHLAKTVEECYFRSAYENGKDMVSLVLEDGKLTGEVMSKAQASKLVTGIQWKNVLENYAHLGITKGGLSSGVTNIEDMITNITTVLVKSRAIHDDPTDGQPNKLYYDRLLASMSEANFHPGLTDDSTGSIRQEVVLEALSEEQWKTLLPVGDLQVEPLVFARGTSRLTDDSKVVLDRLVKHLKTWPTYYVAVKGNASVEGNIEANKDTAMRRAAAAASYLSDHGIDQNRIRPVSGEPTGETNVTFMLGQRPY